MVANYREPEDFLSDDSFLAWYFKTGPDQEKEWDLWIAANPDRRELVQQAIELLEATLVIEKAIPPQRIKKAEDALMQQIMALPVSRDLPETRNRPETSSLLETVDQAEIKALPETADQPEIASRPEIADRAEIASIRRTRMITPFRWRIAASIIVLLAAGLYFTRALDPRKPELRTQYGQISQQQLPDGTEVTINANSKLTYSNSWKDGTDREVWVNGEAFFHVTKTPLKSRFIVHTDQFDVIVTGTQFNVVNRHKRASVMLQEGSVILQTSDGRSLHMTPGDFVEFGTAQMPEKRLVKNDSLLAWKEQKLVFNKTPLEEIVTIINDQYGIPVKLMDDSVGRKTVSGIMPNNNLDVLLQALEATSEFDVIRAAGDDSITIKAHS